MASDRINRRRGSGTVVALPENDQRKVSLTGYSNIVIDESARKDEEEEPNKLRYI